MEPVIKAKLVDWEESLPTQKGRKKGVFSSPMTCCCSRTPLYSGTLLFCQCFVPEFSNPGRLLQCCSFVAFAYLLPLRRKYSAVSGLLVISILQPPWDQLGLSLLSDRFSCLIPASLELACNLKNFIWKNLLSYWVSPHSRGQVYSTELLIAQYGCDRAGVGKLALLSSMLSCLNGT